MKAVCDKIRRIKAEVRKEHPLYTEGNNMVPRSDISRLYKRSVDRSALKDADYDDMRAFLDDGSSLMDEGWMNAYIYSDPRNIVKDYFWGAQQQVYFCRFY